MRNIVSFGVTALTWGALVVEAILFFAFFIDRKWHGFLLLLGLLFHFFIILMFGLFSFFFAMAGGLVMYLGPKKGFEYKSPLHIYIRHFVLKKYRKNENFNY